MNKHDLPTWASHLDIRSLHEVGISPTTLRGLEAAFETPISRVVVAIVAPDDDHRGGRFIWLLDPHGEVVGDEIEITGGIAEARAILAELAQPEEPLASRIVAVLADEGPMKYSQLAQALGLKALDADLRQAVRGLRASGEVVTAGRPPKTKYLLAGQSA